MNMNYGNGSNLQPTQPDILYFRILYMWAEYQGCNTDIQWIYSPTVGRIASDDWSETHAVLSWWYPFMH